MVKKQFKKKYSHVDMSKFDFESDFDKNRTFQ